MNCDQKKGGRPQERFLQGRCRCCKLQSCILVKLAVRAVVSQAMMIASKLPLSNARYSCPSAGQLVRLTMSQCPLRGVHRPSSRQRSGRQSIRPCGLCKHAHCPFHTWRRQGSAWFRVFERIRQKIPLTVGQPMGTSPWSSDWSCGNLQRKLDAIVAVYQERSFHGHERGPSPLINTGALRDHGMFLYRGLRETPIIGQCQPRISPL